MIVVIEISQETGSREDGEALETWIYHTKENVYDIEKTLTTLIKKDEDWKNLYFDVYEPRLNNSYRRLLPQLTQYTTMDEIVEDVVETIKKAVHEGYSFDEESFNIKF